MEAFNQVLDIAKWITRSFSLLYLIAGGIQWFTAFKEHNGPDQKNGMLQVISGAGIFALSFLIDKIKDM